MAQVWLKKLYINKNETSTMKNVPWISADVQACIEPPLIPLIKVELEELHATHTIKVKVQINPSQVILETYKMDMSIIDNNQPE